jgi:hypothetical protein
MPSSEFNLRSTLAEQPAHIIPTTGIVRFSMMQKYNYSPKKIEHSPNL